MTVLVARKWKGKWKGYQSSKNKTYYERQYSVTEKNKSLNGKKNHKIK